MRKIVTETLKAGVGQTAALISAAASVKILAITSGPSGVGLFSLLRQVQQTLVAISSVGGQNAIVQGLTSRHIEQDKMNFRVASLWSILVASSIVAIGVCLFSNSLAYYFLPNHDAQLILWLLFPVAAGTALIYFRGLLNASMYIGAVSWVNVVTSLGAVVSVIPAGILYKQGHLDALIIILASSLSLGALTAYFFSARRGCLKNFWGSTFRRPESEVVMQFLRIAFPSLAVTFVSLGSILIVRAKVAHWFGLGSAGHFDAAWAISALYLTLFLSSLQTYLLPAISGSVKSGNLQLEVDNALRLSAIVVVPLISAMILIKPAVVSILYSGEFAEAVGILRWTLMADSLRVAAWVFATLLLAHADMRAYFSREILWNVFFVALALWLMRSGIEGAGPAYLIAYTIYFFALLWRTVDHYKLRFQLRVVAYWLMGLSIILLMSSITWSDKSVVWWKCSFILLAILYSLHLMKATERARVFRFLRIG